MRGLLIGLISLILTAPALAKGPAYVAIIIDDMGNNQPLGERAIDLPGQLTYSVLPFTPYARALANRAHSAGKEIMLHEPMSNIAGSPLGPGALTMGLSHDAFIRTFDDALASVPWTRGVNNHEGSLLTQQTLQMNWLMADIKRRGLYFIDSRTTAQTVALRIARQDEVRSARRNIFLDDESSLFDIDHQFRELIRTAEQEGTAIAIGHPHKLTLEYLAMAIPQLAQMDIHLVPVSRLIALQQMTRVQYARREHQ